MRRLEFVGGGQSIDQQTERDEESDDSDGVRGCVRGCAAEEQV